MSNKAKENLLGFLSVVIIGVIFLGGYYLIESFEGEEAVYDSFETAAPVVTATIAPTATPTKTPEPTPIPTPTPTPKPVYEIDLTEDEIKLVALCTMAEAEGESELGKRLVIDTILNRVDDDTWPNTVKGVVYQDGQYTAMHGSRVRRVSATEEVCQLVREELVRRTNYEVVYFRTKGYHKRFGTPLFKEGNHYFSGK